jgi:hypothetical protein
MMALAAVVSVNDCGAGKGIFDLRELSISPTRVNPGDPLRLHVKYVVPDGIFVNAGTVNYAVQYNFIPFLPTVEPLCSGIPCPLGPGTYINDTVTTWPTGLHGSVITTITWVDDSSRLLACLSVRSNSV